ncbi:hypothetical protein PHYPO_G00154290 [Pangasianodon hypophthalmus]|uniref:Uncharacterized protein n=2 Tax=Pangasianodon hypophthalmus TaxID=310915 RepID=A0A5N5K1E0_PANHP|nr:hypothetical protein PHYPO_G00154290 [Pangasianodon hypophthalmus]
MHFQPLEEIAENLEESTTRNHNLALFNRLLSSAPSPTSIVGGAFCRTSAQLQRLTRSVSPDSSYSDGEEGEGERYIGRNEGTGGSLPSGLGNDTQSTICSCGGTSNTHTPLSAQEFNPSHAINRGHEEDGLKKDKNEKEWTMLKIPPPLTRVLKQKMKPRLPPSTSTNRSTPDLFSFHPIRDQAKVMTPQSTNGNALSGMTLLTVPQWASEEHKQRQRSISMGSDVNCLSNKAED